MIQKDSVWAYDMLKQVLGLKPNPEIWKQLSKRGDITKVIKSRDIQWLKQCYHDLEKPKPKRTKVQEMPPDLRHRYLSEILAWDAAQEPGIVSFRKDVLNDRLLSPPEIEDWINSHKGKGEYIGLLGYAVLGDKWAHFIPILEGSVLQRLKELSELLHTTYDWQEAQATTFVLTGTCPLLPLAQSTLSLHSLYPALNTMTIKVSLRLSPKQVAAIYDKARYQFRSQFRQKRNRLITKKHLELAVYCHPHLVDDDPPEWKDIMGKWNESHPKKQSYTEVTNFARDAQNAHERLVGTLIKKGKSKQHKR